MTLKIPPVNASFMKALILSDIAFCVEETLWETDKKQLLPYM